MSGLGPNPGVRPDLPDRKGDEVEYLAADMSAKWRFTNVDADTWLVHMAGSEKYEGLLRRDRSVFDYEFRRMEVGQGSGNGVMTGVTFGELFSLHFG